MYILVQPAPFGSNDVPVRLVPLVHAALPARARRGDGFRCFCAGFKGLRVKGAVPGVEFSRVHLNEGGRGRAVAFLFSLAAGPRPRGRVSHPEEALHAVIRCGRGEASVSEPFDRALVLGALRRRRVCAFTSAVFFVTLGTVSSSDREFSLSRLDCVREQGDFVWPLQSVFVALFPLRVARIRG